MRAICVAFAVVAVSSTSQALAESGQQAVPPPVPFYGSHVSKTAVLAPGIVVIDTEDSFDTVLAWYRANLKDRMADVALGQDHQHFLTRVGAGVDISAINVGGRKRTKISLLWKPAGTGSYANLSPDQKMAAEPAPPPVQKQDETTSPPTPSLPAQKAAEAAPPAKPASPPVQQTLSETAQPPSQAPSESTQTVAEVVTPVKPILLAPVQTPVSFAPVQPIPTEIAAPPQPVPAEKVATAIAPVKAVPSARGQKTPGASVPAKQVPAVREALAAGREAHNAEIKGHNPEAKGLEFFRAGQYAEAILTWEDAAAAGSADAALALGMMYDAGEGVPQSYPQALDWYRMAAEAGSVAGAFNVGAMYDGGFGVRQNTAEAAGWYQRAAARGSGRAAFNLALLFENGDGVAQDPQSAGRYFRQAAQSGVVAARGHLRGRASRSSDDGDEPFSTLHIIAGDTSKRNVDQATAERLRVAADNGDSTAQYDLAYCLERGTAGDIDLRQAYTLYHQAAAGAPDSRLKAVADAGARQVRSHLEAAGPGH